MNNCLSEVETITATMGETVDEFFERVIVEAKKKDEPVFGCFNETFVRVYPQSYIKDLLEKWILKHDMSVSFEEVSSSTVDNVVA